MAQARRGGAFVFFFFFFKVFWSPCLSFVRGLVEVTAWSEEEEEERGEGEAGCGEWGE